MKQSMFPSTSRARIPRREYKQTSLNSAKLATKQQQQQIDEEQESCSSRDPFQDLSNDGPGIVNVCSSSISTNASSVSSSIEAPRGCLRFFLNHTSNSKSPSTNKKTSHHRTVKVKSLQSAKTPKSAPNSKQPTRENSRPKPTAEKVNGNPSACLYKRQSGKTTKPCSGDSKFKSAAHSVCKLKSGSGNVGKLDSSGPCNAGVSDSNSTPLRTAGNVSGLNVAVTGRVVLGDEGKCKDNNSGLKCTSESSSTKTPPLHATVSPEIQCQSSVISTATNVTTTPVCYGAGHLLSGVTDKRKCRPRGLLVVGEDIAVEKFDIDDHDADDVLVDGNSNCIDLSPSALPVKASMHWLPSPVNKHKEEAEDSSQNCTHDRHGSSSSCSYNTSEEKMRKRMNRSSAASHSRFPEFGGFLAANLSSDMDISPLEEKLFCYDGDSKSPFSMDLLCSVNVVQTPESESGSRLSKAVTGWTNEKYKQGWGSELDSVERHLQNLFSTPPPLFRFDLPTTTCDPADLSQFQKTMDIPDSQLSISTLGGMSRSDVRISWRDGLVSRIFEMDELDCCRCLSDEEEEEEEEENCGEDGHLESHRTHKLDVEVGKEQPSSACFGTPDGKHCLNENVKDDLPAKVPYLPAAESMAISRDGGGLLFQSDDSDWTQCYKNKLFKV